MVGYDLNRPGQDYSRLIEAIEAYGTWWHSLDSTWIIKTPKSVTQVRDELRRHIDSSDELFVAELTGHAAWSGFDQTSSEWLKKYL
ncbi:hypothetical protein [Streptomyces alkaliterrae]|uniref:hypothetical protein n=1 Tax=Streptomyces alkaliterrae TaxID=2213162 RepID=UPI001E3460A1|nr:hypothetical protein [Streptomyces alkaliterrae]